MRTVRLPGTAAVATWATLLLAAFAGIARADDCLPLGGTVVGAECQIGTDELKCGLFNLTRTLHIVGAGKIQAGDCGLEIDITGNLILDGATGSQAKPRIVSPVQGSPVAGGLTVMASGNIELRGNGTGSGGAVVSSRETTCQPPPADDSSRWAVPGSVILVAGGDIVLERGSAVLATSTCSMGEIALLARGSIVIDGTISMEGPRVLSKATGGPVTVTAGADLLLGDEGSVRSDTDTHGPNRVHLEAVDLVIHGEVASTSGGDRPSGDVPGGCAGGQRSDKPADSRACVELVAQGTLTVDRSAHAASVRADVGTRGTQGVGWISLHGGGDIAVLGGDESAGDAGFVLRANGSNALPHGGRVILKSRDGGIVTSGLAIQANGEASTGTGGWLTIQSGGSGAGNGLIDLTDATIEARGAAGGTGAAGGLIEIRSYNDVVRGSAAASLDASGGAGRTDGSVTVQGCATTPPAVDFDGTVAPSATVVAPACGGTPSRPGYLALGPGRITGTINATDPPFSNFIAFLDANGDDLRQPGERFVTTDATSKFVFTTLRDSSYRVCVAPKLLQFKTTGATVPTCRTANVAAPTHAASVSFDSILVAPDAPCVGAGKCTGTIRLKPTHVDMLELKGTLVFGSPFDPRYEKLTVKLSTIANPSATLHNRALSSGKCLGSSKTCTFSDANAKTQGGFGLVRFTTSSNSTNEVGYTIQTYADLHAAQASMSVSIELGDDKFLTTKPWKKTSSTTWVMK